MNRTRNVYHGSPLTPDKTREVVVIEGTEKQNAAVKAFMKAALQDGWLVDPECSGRRRSMLKREMFLMLIEANARNGALGSGASDASIHIWGPDQLCVVVPTSYSFEAIRRALRVCNFCRSEADEIHPVGNARCCGPCLAAKKQRGGSMEAAVLQEGVQ